MAATLLALDRPVAVSTLATHVAARERDCPPTAITDRDRLPVRASLHHAHLPKLADLGIVDWSPTTRNVALTEDRGVRRWLRSLLETDLSVSTLCERVKSPRRRAVIAVISTRDEALSVGALAEAVASRVDGDSDRIAVSLRHADLPALANAGALEYDRDRQLVAPTARQSVRD